MNKDHLLKRVFLVVLGQSIIGAGINLMIYVNLGVDPLGVFHTGVASVFNTTFAMALFIENAIALVIVFFIDKKYINIATVASLFVVSLVSGPIMKFYELVISDHLPFFARVLLLLLACTILAIGLNFYVLADLGMGAVDAFPEMIANKGNFEIGPVKVIVDLVFLGAGILMGGSLGIGTFISAFAVGPIIQVTRKMMKEPIHTFLSTT